MEGTINKTKSNTILRVHVLVFNAGDHNTRVLEVLHIFAVATVSMFYCLQEQIRTNFAPK